MTLTQLNYILAVDRERNFAKAAESCNVTQPTLSMQIKKLEKEFDAIIFDRTKKPVVTTDIGKYIIEQSRKVIDESQKVSEIIKSYKGVVDGKLKVGVIPTVAPYLIPLFVTEFMDKYEEVELDFDEMMTQDIIDALKKEIIDVGILVTPVSEKGMQEIPLYYELFVAYVNPENPLYQKDKLSYDDLYVEDMWLLKEGHCFRHQAMNLCHDKSNDKSTRLQFESGSIETLKRIVERQHGFTLLPELATTNLTEKEYELVRNFSKPQPVREVSLLVRRTFMKKKLIDLLKDEIKSSVPQILLNKSRGNLIEWKD